MIARPATLSSAGLVLRSGGGFSTLLVCLILVALLTACSGPGYYLQAVSGHWKLMHARQDVEGLLADPSIGADLTNRLLTAEQILSFANGSLDLPANGSYSSYVELDGNTLVFNVVAAEEFSLQPKTWCFLVAGCVPYRGYFKQQQAEDYAQRLRNKGLDVYVAPAMAYSSLGWFQDPLLSSMFTGPDYRLAAYLMHELAHQRLYVKGDGRFNESYASFVEATGVALWLESGQHPDDLNRWLKLQAVSEDFVALIKTLRETLGRVYYSSDSEPHKRKQKSELLRAFEQSLKQLRAEKWDGKDYFSRWSGGAINNAMLALFNTYSGSHCAFQNLLEKAGGKLREFHRLAEQKSRLPANERENWLQQACAGIL